MDASMQKRIRFEDLSKHFSTVNYQNQSLATFSYQNCCLRNVSESVCRTYHKHYDLVNKPRRYRNIVTNFFNTYYQHVTKITENILHTGGFIIIYRLKHLSS